MTKNERVRDQVELVKEKAKRKFKKPPAENMGEKRKKERELARAALRNDLSDPNSEGLVQLAELRKEKILASLPKRNLQEWTPDNVWSQNKDQWLYPPLVIPEDDDKNKNKNKNKNS
jgi:hypothetical protein